MAILLSEAAHCEHAGAYGYEGSSHQAGNQTGDELRTIPYYNLPWAHIYRCNNAAIAENIALRQTVAVINQHIGYSQPNRGSYWTQLEKNNYDPAKITVDCDADCSMLSNSSVQTAFMANNVATSINHNLVTAQMPAAYSADPHFTDVISQIDLSTGKGLKRGDVLVTPGKHTAICTSTDQTLSTTPKWVGEITACTTCPVWSDTNKAGRCQYATLGYTNLIDICDESGAFYYVRIAAKYFGFVEKCYVKQHTTYTQGTVTTDLNMRTAPNGTIIRVIPAGAVVTINSTKTVNGTSWSNITYSGAVGWSASRYIK